MSVAIRSWKEFDGTIQGKEERAHISALIFGFLNAHVISTKLLVWGLLIPAGNMMRQVFETMSMALLASRPGLGFLERYASGKYSTNLAVRDLLRNKYKLNLVPEALTTLREGYEFYHKFSHPTLITLATYISEDDPFRVGLGASFDPAKRFAYDVEIDTRVQVAGLFENTILGIRRNLDE